MATTRTSERAGGVRTTTCRSLGRTESRADAGGAVRSAAHRKPGDALRHAERGVARLPEQDSCTEEDWQVGDRVRNDNPSSTRHANVLEFLPEVINYKF